MTRSAALGTLILLGVWYALSATGIVRGIFLPAPGDVFRSLAGMIVSGAIPFDLLSTLWRTSAGFVLGAGIGLSLGILMGHYKALYQLMELPVDFFRSIPATAMFPLFIAAWGLGSVSKIFITAWAVGMVVLVNSIYGMRSVSALRLLVAKTKRVSPHTTFFVVMIPSALPYIFAGFRLGLSLALVVELVAEMFLGSQDGLGRRIFNATSIFDMTQAYAAVFTVGLTGYVLNQMILMIEKRLIHWSGK